MGLRGAYSGCEGVVTGRRREVAGVDGGGWMGATVWFSREGSTRGGGISEWKYRAGDDKKDQGES